MASFKDRAKKTCYLASSSKDSQIRVWKIWSPSSSTLLSDYTFELVQVCQGHTQDVGALSFSKQAFSFLVSGSIDTTIKLWRIENHENKKKPKNNNGGEETRKLSVAFTVKAHENDINCVSVSPNDKLVASGSSDKTAKVNYLKT